MTQRKKILFFLPGIVGGAERMTITIGKKLPKEEFDVRFVVVMNTLGDIMNFIPEEYPVIHIKINNIWNFGTIRMAYLMKKERPYAVFSSMMYLNARIAIAAKIIGGIKVVIRNSNYMTTTRIDQYLLCRWFYPYADKIISQQEEMADDIIRTLHINPTKVITLHNPLDTITIDNSIANAQNPYPNVKQTKYLWVGRISVNKGQDIAVKAFEKVHKHDISSHLYLVGKYNEQSEYYRNLLDLIDKLKLKDFVHLQGFDANPYRWMRYCDCFVLPSRIEGLPNTLLEAQYIGKPVAASRCIPIIERVIEEGVTGYTANSEDPDDLASAMLMAVRLGDIKSNYIGAKSEDFVKLFK